MTIRPEIDTIAARGLKGAGLSWRQVGVLLAKQAGRPVALQADSVARAVRGADRERAMG